MVVLVIHYLELKIKSLTTSYILKNCHWTKFREMHLCAILHQGESFDLNPHAGSDLSYKKLLYWRLRGAGSRKSENRFIKR